MKENIIVRSYKLKKENFIKKGRFSVVFLTDLHIEKKDSELLKIEEKIDTLQPDLILVGGDVIVGKPGKSVKYAIDFMRNLSQKYKVVYANGNHEQRVSELSDVYGTMGSEYDSAIKNLSIIRLINEKLDLEINGVPVAIYGHQPDYRFYGKGKRPKGMDKELTEQFYVPDKDKYTILLSHNPRFEKEYLSWGADLTLSGHYHGGVVLLGPKRGLITPDFRLFSAQCCGIREKEERKMIVSAGIGEHTVPIRLHNPKEITYISVECS